MNNIIADAPTSPTSDKKKSNMQPRHARSSTVARPVSPPARETERPMEKPVEFTLTGAEGASTAAVAGSFNGWDVERNPLRKDGHSWKATVWLPPGRYEYRFVLDGNQWLSDPKAKESVQNEFGSTNSIVVV